MTECVMCNGTTNDELGNIIIANIKNSGQHLTGVFDAEHPFLYTTGNIVKNLPELFIFFNPQKIAGLINYLCDIQRKRNEPLYDGEIIDIGATCPLMAIVPDDRILEYATISTSFANTLGMPVSFVQILAPDTNGVFPTNPNCKPPYNVPVLRAVS